MTRSQRQPKPLPFTEVQIRERAYKLWQERGESTSSEDNWQAAIEALKRERSPLWKLHQELSREVQIPGEQNIRFVLTFPWRLLRFLRLAVTAETPSAALDVVKVVISGFGVLATIFAGVGLYLTYQNSQAERQLNTERLLTERFTKSVEQLGSKNIDVRLGGIYSLERIAKDSPKDHWTVMEVLTAFVRNKSPVPKGWADAIPQKRQLLPDVTTDVQSALTVIGRRVAENDNVSRTLYTRFRRLDLQSSNLSSADLTRANLKNTNFRGTVLYNATIVVADLRETDLQGAYFNGARLGFTNLGSARLLDTNFDGADIFNVNFIDADYIAPKQIKQAKQWQKAYYDPNFSKQLGLQPQKLPDIFSDPALNP